MTALNWNQSNRKTDKFIESAFTAWEYIPKEFKKNMLAHRKHKKCKAITTTFLQLMLYYFCNVTCKTEIFWVSLNFCIETDVSVR